MMKKTMRMRMMIWKTMRTLRRKILSTNWLRRSQSSRTQLPKESNSQLLPSHRHRPIRSPSRSQQRKMSLKMRTTKTRRMMTSLILMMKSLTQRTTMMRMTRRTRRRALNSS